MRTRLDRALVARGIVDSRSRAQGLIAAGKVLVGGLPATKIGTMVSPDTPIVLRNETPDWVSRGAFKLLGALDTFGLDPKDACCLDVGASTGGFTEVLLRRHARRVVAVDVGYGQLAWSLRNDPRVELRERTNARYLTPLDFDELFKFVVVDASFISLQLLIPSLEKLLIPEGHLIALVKPQFEAGKEHVGKRGVVRSPEIHTLVLQKLLLFLASKSSLAPQGLTFSPIRGPEGNVEFLLHLTFESPSWRVQDHDETIRRVVESAHQITSQQSQECVESCPQSDA